MRRLASIAFALVIACSKKGDAMDAGAEASAPVASVVAVEDAGPLVSARKPPAGAASWSSIARWEDDAVLAKQTAVLLPHFGADAGAGGFLVQRIALVGTREARLVTRANGGSPMVLVTEDDKLLWTKENPVAGIVPPVEHVTLTAHEALGVAIFAWNATTGVVVGRVWAEDSNAFGDFSILHLGSCSDVVAAYVPEQGIYVVAETPAGPVMQLMNENNVLQRGPSGSFIGAAARAPAPLSLVATEEGALYLGYYASAAAKTSDLFDVVRYQKGKPASAPIEIEVPRSSLERMPMRREGSGVRVDLPKGAVASHAVAVAIDATGAVTRLEK